MLGGQVPEGRAGHFKVRVLRKTRYVGEPKCTGCELCVEVFRYGAMTKDERGFAEVVVEACKGCGSCGASFPEAAISIANYSDEELLAQAKTALQEV